jgi:hypothetical protein
MTLIVARALPGQIRMVGDTRITDRTAIVRGAFMGALRHVILGPDLCFAFTGNFERGQQCLQKVAALYKAEEPYEEMIDVARAVHVDSGGAADFLLGRLADGASELTRIAGGDVERGIPFGWIGEEAAFAVYQEAREKIPRDPDGVPNLLKAFQHLLGGGEGARVDAPCLAIATLQGGLSYAPIGVLGPGARRGSGGLWMSGSEGPGFTVLAPRQPGLGAIAVWFDGRLGALFHPMRRADPIVYRNVSLDDFKRVLSLDLGMQTEEISFDPGGAGAGTARKETAAATDPTRQMLRHLVATLAYRGGKAVTSAPKGFAELRVGAKTRTPAEILVHISDLLDWAHNLARGSSAGRNSEPGPWEQEVERFFAELAKLDAFLATDAPLGAPAEKLIQGPIADALTHVGQLTMLRRLAGGPVRGENYFKAEIEVGRVGPEQSKKRFEFD